MSIFSDSWGKAAHFWGTKLNLPELGVSESLGYNPPSSAMKFPLTPYGERQVTGDTSFVGPVSPQYPGSGQVLGASQTSQATQPAQQSSGGGTQSPPADYYAGWDQTAAQADWAAKLASGEAGRMAGAEDIARQQYEQKNRELNTQYDRLMAQLGQQREELGGARERGLQTLQSSLEEGQGSIDEAKTGVRGGEESAIGQALRTYQDVGRQNRMMARALGILGSSAYGDIQARAGESFAGTRNDIVQQAGDQIANLDRETVKMQNNATTQIGNIEAQYGDLIGRIQMDERFTERERNDALSSAITERNARINEIQDAAAQWQQQVDFYKMQVADQLKAANTGVSNTLGGFGTATTNLGQALTAQTAGSFNQPNYGYTGYSGYLNPSEEEDEYSNLYSPTGSLSILGALGVT